jgi:hypothetical protein
MIIVGIILLVVAYFVNLPGPLDTIALVLGWILLLIGLVFLVLGLIGRPVGGRRVWL